MSPRLRPVRAEDAPETVALADEALREAGTRYGWETPPLDDARRARAAARHRHLQATDPDGAWVAEGDAGLLGVAFALRRGPLWFLSLLAVRPGAQAQGVGRALLDAALATAEGSTAGMIMSSSDPKALRRYGRAGFALQPGFDLDGTVDRALLPPVRGVREGDWAADGERVDARVARLRGAGYGPDLAAFAAAGTRLLLSDRGHVLVREGGVSALAADDDAAAEQLLWAALAEGGGHVEAVTGAQQWALRVALAARLEIRPGTAVCTRGAVGPLRPYLLSGAYG